MMAARLFFICLLLCTCTSDTLSQEQRSPQRIYSLFERGYALLPSNPREAAGVFEEILRVDPGNVTACRQLGSIYIALGDREQALRVFADANTLLPSDTTQMQIAYILSSLGRRTEALDVFTSLETSADSSIRSDAHRSAVILELMACSDQYPWWTRVYAAPYFDTRFDDLIFSGSLYRGKYLDTSRTFSAYGTLSITRDTRSSGGTSPAIYSDNYALAGIGVRYQAFAGFTADLQSGLTVDLVERPGEATLKGDFRAVASYGYGIYPAITLPDKFTWPLPLFADVYASFGYYTRYRNAIGYLQTRIGTRLLERGNSALDIYVRGDLTGDTERDFFNNTAEAGLGFRVIPDHRWGLIFSAEFHRGTYWGSSRIPNPYGSPYSSLRLYVILDRFLCW